MSRIWGYLKNTDNRITEDKVAAFDEDLPDFDVVVDVLCTQLDIPRPVVLSKHQKEYSEFLRTVFTAEDFIESVHFKKFEIEYLKEKKKKRGL